MSRYQISASLLSADFARLGQEAHNILEAGADTLHFDVMDNHFVPNLTMGPMFCEALRKYGIIADINVHLMVKPVDRLIGDFIKAGASEIIFHPESSDDVKKSLALIKKENCRAGLAINPETSVECVIDFLDQLDSILIMSVHPGFGGQKFIPQSLEKISELQKILISHHKHIPIGVDGGVHIDNIADVARAGATRLISGSGIFKKPYLNTISQMREKLKDASI